MTAFVNIAEVVGSEFCLSNEDGHRVHNLIYEALNEEGDVTVSFKGVRRTTTAFLNVAIGQLYGEYKEEVIRQHLKVIDAEPSHLSQLKRVVEGAKLFFKNQEMHQTVQDLVHNG